MEVSRTTLGGRERRSDAIALTCLRQFGNLLALTGDLDGVHYENDPLLLFLVRPPDVALCVRTMDEAGSIVVVSIERTDVRGCYDGVEVDASALPGSLAPACVLLAEWAAQLRSKRPLSVPGTSHLVSSPRSSVGDDHAVEPRDCVAEKR